MKTRNTTRARLLALAVVAPVALAACGGADAEEPAAAPPEPAAATEEVAQPAADEPAEIDVRAGESALGDVLTAPDGRTLYAFTNDVDATSTCYGTCADAWPPLIVDVDFLAGPGLDFGIFATTVREDGNLQLVAGKFPLYTFAGDAAPGDLKGQGSGDVWFAVDTDGLLIEGAVEGDEGDVAAEEADAAAGPVGVGETAIGDVMIDAEGLTLYGFLPDGDAGGPTCNDACADAWPPLLVDSEELPEGLDPELFSVVHRDDDTHQLAAGKWPLYRFAGDAAAGDVEGQGSGDAWFAVAPDGSLVDAG